MDYALSSKQKFGVVESEIERPYSYPSSYFRQEMNDGSQRLVLGRPATSYTRLLIDWAAQLPEPLWLLYVLVVPRDGTAEAGRYQCPNELNHEQLANFLNEFGEFLECDGRHHLWVANPEHGTLVFDRHNVIYAYGDLDAFEALAQSNGMNEEYFEVPSPHWHKYHAEYDDVERRLLERWEWIHSALRTQDEA